MNSFIFLALSVVLLNSTPVSSEDKFVIDNSTYKATAFNFRQRFLVLHYTACDLDVSLKTLTGPWVSSHYLVPQTPVNGKRKIYQLLPEERRAWTQGISSWRGRTNLNDQGVSIEIVNLGFVKQKDGSLKRFPFPDYQIQAVIDLSKDIVKRYFIDPTNVIGHQDCAPTRKSDPGPLFPWKQLHDASVGAWYDQDDFDAYVQKGKISTLKEFQKDLKSYGYSVNTDGVRSRLTTSAIKAFQTHFRPSNFDGQIDLETSAIMKSLLSKYRN